MRRNLFGVLMDLERRYNFMASLVTAINDHVTEFFLNLTFLSPATLLNWINPSFSDTLSLLHKDLNMEQQDVNIIKIFT